MDGKKEIKVSVRNLVEFVMRGGDIDNRRTGGSEHAMQEGGRIHRKIQRKMGADYQAEVPMKHVVESGAYRIVVEGRADGVVRRGEEAVIDEIKGVHLDLSRLEKPVPVHMAQACCYGYMYCHCHGLGQIGIQITYCNLETEEIRRFCQDKTFEELSRWFADLAAEYEKWAEYLYRHGQERAFPYEYREGQ